MTNKTLHLGSRVLGEGNPVHIVFEAGPTHSGLESALKLVDMAADANADAIKFQMVDAKAIVSNPSVKFSYSYLKDRHTGETETIEESLLEILQRRELTREEWKILIAHCKQRGIDFFSTATTEDELHFLAAQGVDCIKICSGDLTYHHFLRVAAQYDWAIQIDTGSSSIGEVEKAIDVLEEANARKIIINHCPSGYPAHLEGINLNVLRTLKSMFPYPVAFSDHTPGAVMDVAAVALGAHMIEKTITLDRTTRSPEHIMSLEPEDAAAFIKTIREVEIALGSTRRYVSPPERKSRLVARRSLFAACDLPAGSTISQEHLHYSRPGDGIPADMDHLILGRTTAHNLTKGQKLSFSDFK
ncbi:N-acetylneuraminate synthase family protein [Desulfovibrio psychrotolerans]|uniref:N-acetylneuraminate synthase n=1 Tax=Desulfovibrio psychrotolerans TaxID=415242 RepID=A0A7J0BWM8_9BACT|nr:N-acetylneuraminate synthase family protein [Desulfovibrio psychrotolerans]GFM38120.1 N-acetylneuraminate synthase [Desulfovibrio psychrotolerans]